MNIFGILVIMAILYGALSAMANDKKHAVPSEPIKDDGRMDWIYYGEGNDND